MGENLTFSEQLTKVVILLLRHGIDVDFIADATNLTKGQVLQIKAFLDRSRQKKSA
jgi:hypothetical protein